MSIFENTSDNHYTVTPTTLTIYNVTPDDANFYTCNVTNQCGTATIPYTLEVIGKYGDYVGILEFQNTFYM